jgi:hypothetical protein
MAGDSKARKLVERMRDKQSGGGKPGGKPPAKAPPTKAVEVEPVPALEQAPPALPAPRKLRRKGPLFRLPNGSGFWTAYDGESQEWTCLLTVPGLPPFTVRARSLHAGLQRLGHRWWREHGQPQPAEASEEARTVRE